MLVHPLATHRVQAYHCVIEVFLDSVRFTRSFVEFTPLEVLTRFFFQAEDGIRYRSPSRGLGDVYKRQLLVYPVYSRNH